jgi:hypothetical protein
LESLRVYFGGDSFWYMPFTCDLLFDGLEMQVNEGPDLDETGPEEETTQH